MLTVDLAVELAKTEAQIAEASRFNAELDKSEEGKIREKAWDLLLDSCDRGRLWAEYVIDTSLFES